MTMQISGRQGRILIDSQTRMVQIGPGDHIWTPGPLNCDEIGGLP